MALIAKILFDDDDDDDIFLLHYDTGQKPAYAG